MSEKLTVLYHPGIPESAKQKIAAFREAFARVGFHEYRPGVTSIPAESEIIVAFCGDGTFSDISNQLVRRPRNATLLAVAAGTENGFCASLSRAGAEKTLRDLREGNIYDIPLFYPGQVDSWVFNHYAGFGQLLIDQQRWGERLRGRVPSKIRQKLAGFITFAASTLQGGSFNYSFDQVFVSEFLGSYKFPIGQSIYSPNLTRVKVDATSKIEALTKLSRLAFCVVRNKIPCEDIAKIDQSPKFDDIESFQQTTGNIDGEVIDFDRSEYKTAFRSKTGIHVARLIMDR